MSSKISQAFVYLFLSISAALFLAPIIYIALNSFKTTGEIIQVPQTLLPETFNVDNYREIFEGSFATFFKNSIVITVSSVVIIVVTSALAGFAFGRIAFKGSDLLIGALLLVMTLPVAIYLVPIYLMESKADLLNTNLGLILPNVAIGLPFAIFIMRSSFIQIPKELEEAAEIDGCNVFQTWWKVMLPLTKNGLIITTIHGFYVVWGEYTLAKTLAMDPDAMPLTVGLTLFKGETWAMGSLAAIIVLSILPPAIMFIIFQKHIVKGISAGSIKG